MGAKIRCRDHSLRPARSRMRHYVWHELDRDQLNRQAFVFERFVPFRFCASKKTSPEILAPGLRKRMKLSLSGFHRALGGFPTTAHCAIPYLYPCDLYRGGQQRNVQHNGFDNIAIRLCYATYANDGRDPSSRRYTRTPHFRVLISSGKSVAATAGTVATADAPTKATAINAPFMICFMLRILK